MKGNESSFIDSSASADHTQSLLILKVSAIVVNGLIALGSTIPIFGKFAEVLQKLSKVIKQAYINEEAMIRLHNYAVDISELLLPHFKALSSSSALLNVQDSFDIALNNLMELFEEILSYVENYKPWITKAISAVDNKLNEQVDRYIYDLMYHQNQLINLITIANTVTKINDNKEINKNADNVDEDEASNNKGNVSSLVAKYENKQKKSSSIQLKKITIEPVNSQS